ncbi:Protein of unknown function (DUF1538) [Desulfocapsa sulfexigens DSM 10523]|uniref:DUF1538 domain-containing protein n=1 Tax=Desulfocapsa sulfexigens (strain DSM 10523 / SB164P1) TaxID=1167006 RepID=M1PFR8_DESSD|nr:DUF1538 domain-containing protein [Desulfocapsa sulfexigens]AGF78505.1 Protein of unknown function (DUF1538) [Desulfocapsa sulfexigens DSM 10523]
MEFIKEFSIILLATCRDVLPIVLLITVFQLVVLRQKIPNLPRLIVGGVYVILGLALFLAGLEKALFPLGKIMAAQLSDPVFLYGTNEAITHVDWTAYGWVYLFAAMIGFATTIAEPSLIAVAYKANEVSAGTISTWGLRITVAIGVAFGISLGTYRIVTGTPLYLYILVGYVVVIIQTIFAPKTIVALAYDSGGVTTSTVTVPLVAALGLGLASTVPGRNPALDGFGLIAFASLFPIIAVLGYAQLMEWKTKHTINTNTGER